MQAQAIRMHHKPNAFEEKKSKRSGADALLHPMSLMPPQPSEGAGALLCCAVWPLMQQRHAAQ